MWTYRHACILNGFFFLSDYVHWFPFARIVCCWFTRNKPAIPYRFICSTKYYNYVGCGQIITRKKKNIYQIFFFYVCHGIKHLPWSMEFIKLFPELKNFFILFYISLRIFSSDFSGTSRSIVCELRTKKTKNLFVALQFSYLPYYYLLLK